MSSKIIPMNSHNMRKCNGFNKKADVIENSHLSYDQPSDKKAKLKLQDKTACNK